MVAASSPPQTACTVHDLLRELHAPNPSSMKVQGWVHCVKTAPSGSSEWQWMEARSFSLYFLHLAYFKSLNPMQTSSALGDNCTTSFGSSSRALALQRLEGRRPSGALQAIASTLSFSDGAPFVAIYVSLLC